jgi:hypothetical protein
MYRAILDALRDPLGYPAPDIIAAKMGKMQSRDELVKMVVEVGHRPPESLVASAREVIKLADRAATYHAIAKAMTAISDVAIPTDAIKNDLMVELAKARSAEVQPADGKSIMERYEASVGSRDHQPMNTTLGWLKYVTNGGLRKRRLYGIAGPDKSRKSTLARNIILSSLRQPILSPNPAEGILHYAIATDMNAAVLAFENDQVSTAFDFTVMIAWDYLWQGGRGLEVVNRIWRGYPLSYYLNTELVMTAIDDGKISQWPAELQNVIERARAAFKKLPIVIYDSSPAGGGLDTADDLTRVLNMHNALYGSQVDHKIICVDYNGLIRTPGMSAYEGQTEVVARQLYAANAMDFAVLSLAQYSRGYQTAMNGKESGQPRTVGTDNSPALERSVHNYWQVRYDENEPQKLNVMQVRARRAAGGTSGKMQKDYHIQPSTGAIIDEYTDRTRLIQWQ